MAIHSSDPGFSAYLETTRDAPVFVILGVQGSGTNLLGRILRRFYNFSLLRDGSMVFNAAARLGSAPTTDAIQREIQDFTARAFPSLMRRRTRRVLVDYADFPDVTRVLRPEAVDTGGDFARLIYAFRAFRLNTTRMAIKSDDLWENIGAIDDVLPNRRIILITRDFRDNLLSVSGKDFGPIEPLAAARFVKHQLNYYAKEYRRAGTQALHVKFETLVTTPRKFFDDFSNHFQLAPSVDPDAAVKEIHIRPNKTQKWKRLSPQELAWCEGVLYDELLEFGYPPESPRRVLPSQRAVIAAAARDTVKRVPQKIRHLMARMKK
jgi:hypothetical protein